MNGELLGVAGLGLFVIGVFVTACLNSKKGMLLLFSCSFCMFGFILLVLESFAAFQGRYVDYRLQNFNGETYAIIEDGENINVTERYHIILFNPEDYKLRVIDKELWFLTRPQAREEILPLIDHKPTMFKDLTNRPQ